MKLVSKLALAAALAAPSLAPSLSLAEKPNTGGLSFSGGFDVVSSYYFRGYLQENEGLIVQPYFGVSTVAHSTDDYSIGLSLSTWNSIQSEDTGSDGAGAGSWYENDIYVTAPITFGKFVVTPLYYLYQYPNGAFETVQEVGITAAYDDTGTYDSMGDWAKGLALKPFVGVYYEFDDGNGSEDGYWEAGIAPGYTFNEGGQMELPITFPITLGGSYDDYYLSSDGDNDIFGYLQVGVTTSLPLPIPETYGSWALNLGGYYQNLFSDSLEAANNDSAHVFWGKVGISFTY
jgi:hypothetical protein